MPVAPLALRADAGAVAFTQIGTDGGAQHPVRLHVAGVQPVARDGAALGGTGAAGNWGAQLGYDAAGVWKAWAPDLDHRLTRAGHFMAEEAPGEVTTAIQDLLAR